FPGRGIAGCILESDAEPAVAEGKPDPFPAPADMNKPLRQWKPRQKCGASFRRLFCFQSGIKAFAGDGNGYQGHVGSPVMAASLRKRVLVPRTSSIFRSRVRPGKHRPCAYGVGHAEWPMSRRPADAGGYLPDRP